jgi:Clp amino terminal domain, pathogenicity island component
VAQVNQHRPGLPGRPVRCETPGVFERFTERARQVVVLAHDEAGTFKHNYIGTEHLLLGLLREEEGLAARVLDSSVTAAWTDPSPPTDPDDDLGPEMPVWSHSQPAPFSMSCFRCDQALERITLGQTTTSPQNIEGEDDRPCPSCRKPWRISYHVSWEDSQAHPHRRVADSCGSG